MAGTVCARAESTLLCVLFRLYSMNWHSELPCSERMLKSPIYLSTLSIYLYFLPTNSSPNLADFPPTKVSALATSSAFPPQSCTSIPTTPDSPASSFPPASRLGSTSSPFPQTCRRASAASLLLRKQREKVVYGPTTGNPCSAF